MPAGSVMRRRCGSPLHQPMPGALFADNSRASADSRSSPPRRVVGRVFCRPPGPHGRGRSCAGFGLEVRLPSAASILGPPGTNSVRTELVPCASFAQPIVVARGARTLSGQSSLRCASITQPLAVPRCARPALSGHGWLMSAGQSDFRTELAVIRVDRATIEFGVCGSRATLPGQS